MTYSQIPSYEGTHRTAHILMYRHNYRSTTVRLSVDACHYSPASGATSVIRSVEASERNLSSGVNVAPQASTEVLNQKR